MRDDRMKWAPLPDTFLTAARDRVTIAPRHVGFQYLVSGLSVVSDGSHIGWPEVCVRPDYTLSIRRDQILRVGCVQQATGWIAETGQAVSDMSDGYQVFEVSGPKAFDVLSRGAELDLSLASASTARALWGVSTLLYRHGNDTTFRLHVERSYAMGLYMALVTAADQAASQA